MVLGYVNTGRTGRGKHIVFDGQVDYIVVCIAGVVGLNVIIARKRQWRVLETHTLIKTLSVLNLENSFANLTKKLDKSIYRKYGILCAYLGRSNMVKWGLPEKTIQFTRINLMSIVPPVSKVKTKPNFGAPL